MLSFNYEKQKFLIDASRLANTDSFCEIDYRWHLCDFMKLGERRGIMDNIYTIEFLFYQRSIWMILCKVILISSVCRHVLEIPSCLHEKHSRVTFNGKKCSRNRYEIVISPHFPMSSKTDVRTKQMVRPFLFFLQDGNVCIVNFHQTKSSAKKPYLHDGWTAYQVISANAKCNWSKKSKDAFTLDW